MELVEGIGLAYLVDVQNETMRENRLRVMIELGEAIEYLHKEKWIHRDLCPRNVLLDKQHCTKLIDFGLVVPNTRAFQEPGNRTGTANYMAPELIKRQRTDQRIDIFSYAVTCFEMYCKELPWPSITGASLEMMLKRINTRPRDIRELVPKLDDQIATARSCAGWRPKPQNRWQNVSEMVAELRLAYHRLEPPPKPEETKKRTKKTQRRFPTNGSLKRSERGTDCRWTRPASTSTNGMRSRPHPVRTPAGLAVPAAGKTRVITYRTAELIRRARRPTRILLGHLHEQGGPRDAAAERPPCWAGRHAAPRPLVDYVSLALRANPAAVTPRISHPPNFAIYDRGTRNAARGSASRNRVRRQNAAARRPGQPH